MGVKAKQHRKKVKARNEKINQKKKQTQNLIKKYQLELQNAKEESMTNGFQNTFRERFPEVLNPMK